jgi:hypothetical protein
LGKAEALQAAQTAVRTGNTHPEWAQPYYWAAFTLTGDPGKVKARTTPIWPTWGIAIGVVAALSALGIVVWRLKIHHRGDVGSGRHPVI